MLSYIVVLHSCSYPLSVFLNTHFYTSANMHLFQTLVGSISLFTTTLGLTILPNNLSLHPRGQRHCKNAPDTIAGRSVLCSLSVRLGTTLT